MRHVTAGVIITLSAQVPAQPSKLRSMARSCSFYVWLQVMVTSPLASVQLH
jgi:hypothetical protein